jgi:hypothetical protein
MALGEIFEVVWCDIFYAPLIYYAIRNVALFNQFPQPRSGLWIVFVVICRHASTMYAQKIAVAAVQVAAMTQSCQSPIAH